MPSTRRSLLRNAALVAVVTLAAFAAGMSWSTGALAQGTWPSKPLTMIVPFPPGGVADTVARPVAEALGRELKQTVVVENRAGAGGAVGIGQVARAPADGYTVLLSLSSISILPEADAILDRKPAYQTSQFKPIARFTADPTVLVVRADAPWKNMAEFLADAKAKPATYNYGSSGNYGTMHVPMEMFKNAAGFRMTHIPYTGAGPAIVALLAGQVDAIATGPSTVAQQIKAGKLRALAHWGDRPLASLPDVPSLTQLGGTVRARRHARGCDRQAARCRCARGCRPGGRASDREGRQSDRLP
jgi:tripartite-type tricarboxylate transporter receptor subunit TctC